ncbi:hypothetical protein [Bradyrhizobium erythrophlei]|uniref:Uncharacterized protein n=1 Tax=Bradyrhizobium erythrophlei TaxID=1437360 RepID=A0A1M5NJL6_9BRAD|nr:hypothetical protein [Bradyrhizobium erythrophlei]SHG89784.1 hypothetical protein SAMN05443248_3023 [Bradyrhizobium erythrophlei]
MHIQFEGLADYPFYAVAVCPNENDNWFCAGQSRAAALAAFEVGLKQFPKPAYRVVARFDPERLKKDLALFAMPSPSGCAH